MQGLISEGQEENGGLTHRYRGIVYGAKLLMAPCPCRQVLHTRDEPGDRGHICDLLETAYGFDEGGCLPGADARGREAPELVTHLFPGQGVVRRPFVGLRRQDIALTGIFEQYLGLYGGWTSVRGILQRHQFDALRQVAYARVVYCLIIVDERIGEIARECYRGRKWQAILPSHDAFRRTHGVALFHDARNTMQHHPRDVLGL